MQRSEDGCFGDVLGAGGKVEGGGDPRPCCCAAGIRYILRGPASKGLESIRDIDVEALVGYIRSSQVCRFVSLLLNGLLDKDSTFKLISTGNSTLIDCH